MTILVVDDDSESRTLLTALLTAEGYDVRAADGGELALASMAVRRPDLILLDLRMPDMDGLEVCRRVKERVDTRDIPLMFLSASGEVTERVEGLRLGAVDFITKPFQREELLARVRTHLELGRLRAHLQEQVEERTAELHALVREKSLLLKEVQHRVKNNLQVISSLLSLQSARVADSELRKVFEASRDRVRSMSLIHEQLCFIGDIAQIEFRKYAQDLTGSLLDSYDAAGGKVQFHLDVDVKLGLDAAVPCGLILNELLSNSLKHAFPNGREGEVWLDFHHRDGEFELRYRDNGVGFPPDLDIEQAESLGLQLITDLAAQLGGALEHDGRDGALFIVKFKSQKGPKESNKGGSHSDFARRG